MIKDFIKIDDVPENLIKEYEDKLPAEVIEIWKNYGFGTFYSGFLKVINPNDYKELLENSYFRGDVSIPIFATGFGDLITWEKNQFIGIVQYRYGENHILASGFDFFFEDIASGSFGCKYFGLNKFNEAVKKYGDLEYDQCFGYVPLLGLGGKESVNNLKKVKIREHILLITQLVGEV